MPKCSSNKINLITIHLKVEWLFFKWDITDYDIILVSCVQYNDSMFVYRINFHFTKPMDIAW